MTTPKTLNERVSLHDLRTSLEFFRTAPRDEVLDELVTFGFMTEEERRRLDRGDTATPDTWSADASPFDPVRAGMFPVEEPGHENAFASVPNAQMEGDEPLISIVPTKRGEGWEIVGLEGLPFYIPRTMPDGTPRTHADVLSILRANGWTGGDDE